MKILDIDEKWSVQYDPLNNDRPVNLLRHGEVCADGPSGWNNPIVAMFYALLSKEEQIDGLTKARSTFCNACGKMVACCGCLEPDTSDAVPLPDKPRICSNCTFSKKSEDGHRMFCVWEEMVLPVPLVRARLWGKPHLECGDVMANHCNAYREADRK